MPVFKQTIGVELEAGMVRKSTRAPAIVLDLLGEDGITTNRPFEAVQCELGAYMAELSTPPCGSSRRVWDSLSGLEARIPAEYGLVFKTRPFGLKVPITAKPRYALVREALAREHPQGALNPDAIAPWCSTQYHFGVADIGLPEMLLLVNFLNNVGPYARMRVIEKYGVTGADGHLAIWTKPPSSRIERVPAPRWFADMAVLHRFVEGIPKLVTKNAQGEWVIAKGIPSRIGDPEAEGTLWWFARPRGLLKTVEWRVFPALKPVQAADLAQHMFALAGAFSEYVETHPCASWRTREDAAGLYRHLSQISLLVPPEPLHDDSWWRMVYDEEEILMAL